MTQKQLAAEIARVKQAHTAASALAKLIVAFNEKHPGDPDATVEIPPETWKVFVGLSKKVLK